MAEEEKRPQIVITFESPRSCAAKVEYLNMDRETMASQVVLMGEFLLTFGRQMWIEMHKAKGQGIVIPKFKGDILPF